MLSHNNVVNNIVFFLIDAQHVPGLSITVSIQKPLPSPLLPMSFSLRCSQPTHLSKPFVYSVYDAGK